MARKLLAPVCCILIFSFLAACTLTDTERRDWSKYDGPGVEYFRMPEVNDVERIDDPGEPLNRGFAVFNHGLMLGVFDPLSKVYRILIPGPARDALSRFAENLAFPKRLVNNLFQGKLSGAGRETGRFIVNTTIGLLGLFDPATPLGIEPSDQGFGDTFALWGWDAGSFFMAPFFGPGSDRDTPADILDLAFNPAAYLPGATTLFKLNDETDGMNEYKRFVRTNYDPYTLTRFLFALNCRSRALEVEGKETESSGTETLRAMFLKFQDADFPGECDDDEVTIPATGKDLSYTYIMQDDPAPMIFILPGLGGHRDSNMSLALMEMAYRNGFSAAAISSSMNFEFMESASSVVLPGFGPVDAHDSHVALDLVYKDLMEEYPEQITGTALLGLSLGAYHALEIAAAARDPANKLIDFDRYVPVNPPISLMSGVRELDGYFNAPMQWPKEERVAHLNETIMKALKLSERGLEPTAPIPLTELDAQFLIGLSFRLSLMFAIHCSQSRENLGVLRTDLSGPSRAPAYEEILDYSFMEYYYAFILPYFIKHRDDIRSEEDLLRMCDLRHLEGRLRGIDKVRLFSNKNDFLLSGDDIAWLQGVFGQERVRLFDSGGHLGNLYEVKVQDEIMASISDLLPAK
ncbi:MAG: MlaA family lipoprotein [Planctomycetota bacterium]